MMLKLRYLSKRMRAADIKHIETSTTFMGVAVSGGCC